MLSDQHSSMTPLSFEALLFLKVNRQLWDQHDVSKAMIAAKEERKQERLKKLIDEDEEQSDDDA